MAKKHIRYKCQQCGRTTHREMGKCPQCGQWNTMIAEMVTEKTNNINKSIVGSSLPSSKPRPINEIETTTTDRLALPNDEFARVLGGGIVPGSMVLIGGDPGIGKSTLMLQIATSMAKTNLPVLYVSGEESAHQVKMRATRLDDWSQSNTNHLYLLTETNLEKIIEHILSTKAQLVIIDSIQTITSDDLDSSPGSITQVSNCTNLLTQLAKMSDVAIFLVGHVTKEGSIAGPRVLEHTVDTVLYLEGDLHHAYRLLRGVKNRFGPTSEVGIFEMKSSGMIEVKNPSETFLSERQANVPGSAITVTMEGTRPLLVEVQALASTSTFGKPRRTPNGVDFNRLLLVTAVLTRRLNFRLADQDVFVNIVGGLQIQEPAADLAIAGAIASSVKNQPLISDTVLIGEIGLSGELRASRQMASRLNEAANLGFKSAIIPNSSTQKEQLPSNIQVISTPTLEEALESALKH
ncbi:MAG: DNA repair protein RadA [Anaerolineales bacterium]|nr:DNA repair protein RadA [Anaerolineales bacterium]